MIRHLNQHYPLKDSLGGPEQEINLYCHRHPSNTTDHRVSPFTDSYNDGNGCVCSGFRFWTNWHVLCSDKTDMLEGHSTVSNKRNSSGIFHVFIYL